MKSIKNLLVPLIILICLTVFAIVYFAVDGIKNKQPSETTSGTVTVLTYESSDIASVKVVNQDNGYMSLVRCAQDSGKAVYSFEGDDFDPKEDYSQDKLFSYVNCLVTYYSNNKVSSDGNYAAYGLDTPRFVITIETSNGNSSTVYIGNKTPDGQQCYLYVEGSKDIYTVDILKSFYASKNSLDFLAPVTLGVDYHELNAVHFDRKSDNLSLDTMVRITNSGIADFTIYKPYEHGTSGYFGTLIDAVVNTQFTDFVDIKDSEFSEYGLSDPCYHFVFTRKDGTNSELYLSSLIDGYYYGYIKGNKKFFKVPEMAIEGLNLPELILIDPYICYSYVKDVSSITGTYGDKSFKFNLDVREGSSIMAKDSTVELDGRNAKISDSMGRAYCSVLFESIACIKIGGIEMNPNTNTSVAPALSLTFIDKNYNTTVYAFYRRDDDSYYVFKNDEYMCFYVYATEIFKDGGADTYSYGYWKAYELLDEAIRNNTNGIYDF